MDTSDKTMVFRLLTENYSSSTSGEYYHRPDGVCIPLTTTIVNPIIDIESYTYHVASITNLIGFFTIPDVNIKFSGGYGGWSCPAKIVSDTFKKIIALLPRSDFNIEYNIEYNIIYNSPENLGRDFRCSSEICEKIENLFGSLVEIKFAFYAGSLRSKGYGFKKECTLKSLSNVTDRANELLQIILELVESGKVKETIYQNKELYDKTTIQRLQKEKEEEEYKKNLRAYHYEDILRKSRTISLPSKKKEAITLQKDMFEAAIILLNKFNADDFEYRSIYYLDQINYEFPEEPVKFWKPKHLHCLGTISNKHIVINAE
jgi:hypothetical protein